jgi:haloalkane dehalogenase
MEVKRTPDSRFERLDGYSFAPHFAELKAEAGTSLRVHYVDEGPRAANTGLPVGQGVSPTLQQWLDFSDHATALPVAQLVHGFTVNGLTDAEKQAYDAPFPDGTFQAAALSFPRLIPLQPDNPGLPLMLETWRLLERWTKPLLTVFGDRDPISKGADLSFQQRVPGAKGQPHVTLSPAHHFLQEDQPEAIAEHIHAFAH